MRFTDRCKHYTCPCKGCPDQMNCKKGCSVCFMEGKKNNVGYCSEKGRDGKKLWNERKYVARY